MGVYIYALRKNTKNLEVEGHEKIEVALANFLGNAGGLKHNRYVESGLTKSANAWEGRQIPDFYVHAIADGEPVYTNPNHGRAFYEMPKDSKVFGTIKKKGRKFIVIPQ